MVPPGGGYKMTHPVSGQTFKRHYVDGVIALYREHCEANGYPQPSPQECINIICASTNSTICYDSDEPPFMEKAVSFVSSMARWAASGFKTVTQEQLTERLTICQECQYWGGTTGTQLVGARCGKCGCTSKKLGLATEACPIGKWLPV